jgi:hypothetical protein
MLKNRLQNIYYGVVNYPVGKWNHAYYPFLWVTYFELYILRKKGRTGNHAVVQELLANPPACSVFHQTRHHPCIPQESEFRNSDQWKQDFQQYGL